MELLLQLFLFKLVQANTKPTAKRPPPPPRSGTAPGLTIKQLHRNLANREEIQSLKGLNTGRGSPLVASRGARCPPTLNGTTGGDLHGGFIYQRFGRD
ncbi:hypothetical protein NQZ68_036363 [Dissostichus eleginoides]|nr:hypothetical protein NQZ68_036363 [Dissostichus eleginoides]